MAACLIATPAAALKLSRTAPRSWADIAAGRKESKQPEEAVSAHDSNKPDHAESVSGETLVEIQPSPAEAQDDDEVVSGAQKNLNEHEDVVTHQRQPLRKYLDASSEDTPSTTDGHSNALLQPGARGSWKCFCFGEVVMMCGSYGWLSVNGEVDHPDSEMHEGHIYVHKRDITEGESLKSGDPVSFYLYADERGLGAEYCCRHVSVSADAEFAPEQGFTLWVSEDTPFSAEAAEFVPGWKDAHASTFRASAAEFVLGAKIAAADFDLNITAPEFIPSHAARSHGAECLSPAGFGLANSTVTDFHSEPSTNADFGLNSDAATFTPAALSCNTLEFVPCTFGTAVPQCESESGCEADDETADCVACEVSSTCSDATSDHTSIAEDIDVAVWDEDMEIVVITAPLRRCVSPDDHEDTSSTCDGEVSDSDLDDCAMTVKTSAGWIRPPPGLSVFG